jgi:hypothetical protein
MPVKTFFAPPEDPAGITFNTLNLTVFDNGLQNKYISSDLASVMKNNWI